MPDADTVLDAEGAGETGHSGELEALVAELERKVPRLLERYDVPRAAVAPVRGGVPVWSGGYGYADLATRDPVDSDTVFATGSIAKAITAWTVPRLVDERTLALDDPVIAHSPDRARERRYRGTITVRRARPGSTPLRRILRVSLPCSRQPR